MTGTVEIPAKTPATRPPEKLPPFPAARRTVFLAAIVFCLTPWASPPIALALGVALALLIPNPFRRSTQKFSKLLLQACVVLLGFGMDLPVVLRAGASGLVFAAISIAATLLLGYWLGRLLGVARNTSSLISIGTAICGGSAIAALGSSIDAADAEMTVAIGTVFCLNAVALYLFPPLGHAFHLTQHQFGVWAGVAIHDVSSVVAASGTYGAEAQQIATAVKLARALWIVPLVIGFTMFRRRDAAMAEAAQGTASTGTRRKRGPRVPYFIGLFLLASIGRTYVPAITAQADMLNNTAKVGLTLTLFLIGAALSRKTLASVGPSAFAQGIILWAFIGGMSLLAVLRLS